MMEHTSGESFQNRYPYSTKIICIYIDTTKTFCKLPYFFNPYI